MKNHHGQRRAGAEPTGVMSAIMVAVQVDHLRR
jgi:hypothetical protein